MWLGYTGVFSNLKSLHVDFHIGCISVVSPGIEKESSFPTFWPAFVVICLLSDSNWSDMESQSNFNLFPGG